MARVRGGFGHDRALADLPVHSSTAWTCSLSCSLSRLSPPRSRAAPRSSRRRREERPTSAGALRADVEQQQRRIDALVAALAEAQSGVAAVVRQNPAWSSEQMRDVEKARLRYAAAIDELEQAHDVFADETGALAWLLDPEGGQSSPVNSALAGRTGTVRGREPLRMNIVVDELRADLDQVCRWVADRHDPQPTPRIELAHRREEWAS